jgi:hypothetical protein
MLNIKYTTFVIRTLLGALAIGERRLKHAASGFAALAIVANHDRQKV